MTDVVKEASWKWKDLPFMMAESDQRYSGDVR